MLTYLSLIRFSTINIIHLMRNSDCKSQIEMSGFSKVENLKNPKKPTWQQVGFFLNNTDRF